ncbi:sulfate permease [Dasania marina]|uniref:SulP family inorganic anion transporter n=1 Tax=Dasania marina TaxID=471499 RepID=UPI0030DB78E1|tara:strand:- start:46524 stop:48248 length:1725 start_codon:yes stop_codon:yes gene_type:complete
MLSKLFPGLLWLQGYSKSTFLSDLSSGLTTGVLLIPQGMGYAMVAGLPPEVGLYAAIFPPLLYALLGTSNKVSIGPVALDAILILSGLSLLAEPGSEHYLQLALLLSLLVGLLQFSFGLLRLGFIANFLSYPVIVGYTSAAAVIIICNQLQSLVGVEVAAANVFSQLYQLLLASPAWTPYTVAIGVSSLLLMYLGNRYKPKLPMALLLLIVGMLCSGLLQLSQYGVATITSIPQGLPMLALPSLNLAQITQLLPVAFTVAFMGYVGAISISKSQETPSDKHTAKPNQELIALGAANILGSLFRALPVSASFSRSAVFVKAGAKTQISALISAAFIALILLFLSPLFSQYPLPKTVLAAIIIMSVLGLFKYGEMKSLLQQDKKEFLSLLVTFLITLLLGVQQGLLAGVLVSIMVVVYRSAIPHMTELGLLADRQLYRNINRFQQAQVREELLIFRFDAPLYFANKDYFTTNLYAWIKQRPSGTLKAVIFDAESVNSVDSTAIKMLAHVIVNLQQQNIELYLSHLIGPVRDALLNSPLAEHLTKEQIFATTADAVAYFDGGEHSGADIALQTNPAR